MRVLKILIWVLGMTGVAGTAFGQTVPDSIAICEPGEPPTIIGDVEVVEEPDEVSRVMTVEEVAVATDSIIAAYDADWTDLSMQGKLSFDGLPMSVSVKIYMKRGESVILSARAPFLGEVARVEVDQDSITLINKHTRCYNVQSFAGLDVDPTVYLTDLQDILLGQVAFPGHGRLTTDNALLSQWIDLPSDQSLIYPSSPLQTAGTEYGFVMDSTCWQLISFVLMLQNTGIVLETKYSYGDNGWTLGLDVSLPKKKMGGELQLSYPDYNAAPLDFTALGSKYRKVDFKQLMKF